MFILNLLPRSQKEKKNDTGLSGRGIVAFRITSEEG